MPAAIVQVLALLLIVAIALNPGLSNDVRWVLLLLALTACILASVRQ